MFDLLSASNYHQILQWAKVDRFSNGPRIGNHVLLEFLGYLDFHFVNYRLKSNFGSCDLLLESNDIVTM